MVFPVYSQHPTTQQGNFDGVKLLSRVVKQSWEGMKKLFAVQVVLFKKDKCLSFY